MTKINFQKRGGIIGKLSGFWNRRLIFVLSTLGMLIYLPANSQDPQNMKVAPDYATCDSLPGIFTGRREALTRLDSTGFRMTQQIKTTRQSGVQFVQYLSCDREVGFLVLTIDNKRIVYREVPVKTWMEYIQDRDLDGFYEDKIKGKYPLAYDLD